MKAHETIENRVVRLERRCRMQSVTLAAVGMLAGALVLGGARAGAPGPLDASEVRIVDVRGTVLAHLGPDAKGRAGLALNDAQGVSRLVLSASAETGSLALLDGQGRSRAELTASADGATLGFFSEKEEPGPVMGRTREGVSPAAGAAGAIAPIRAARGTSRK